MSVLKLILSKSEGGKEVLKGPSRCAFSKPSQDNVDAYNMRAVRAIREKNVPLLRTMLEDFVVKTTRLAKSLSFDEFKRIWKQNDVRWLHLLRHDREHPRQYFDEIFDALIGTCIRIRIRT